MKQNYNEYNPYCNLMCVDCLSPLIHTASTPLATTRVHCVSVKIKLMRAWVPADRPTKRNYGKYIYIYIPFCLTATLHFSKCSKCVNNNNNNTMVLLYSKLVKCELLLNILFIADEMIYTNIQIYILRNIKHAKRYDMIRYTYIYIYIFILAFRLIIFKCTRGCRKCVKKKHKTLFYYFSRRQFFFSVVFVIFSFVGCGTEFSSLSRLFAVTLFYFIFHSFIHSFFHIFFLFFICSFSVLYYCCVVYSVP